MKKLLLIPALLFFCCFASCKKEQSSPITGSWQSLDLYYQFTIKDLSGNGLSNFTLNGKSLTWTINEEKHFFNVVIVNPKSMILLENGKEIYFRRLLN